MDLARLRQQAQLRHDDNAGQGTFTLPTGELLALLAVAEAAEAFVDGHPSAVGWDDLGMRLNQELAALRARLAALKESP